MQIKSASRTFALSIAILLIMVLLLACLLAFMPFWLGLPIDWTVSILVALAAGLGVWALRASWRFMEVYRQSPYFSIDIVPNTLKIKNQTHEITIASSEVESYYFHNDRIHIRLRKPTECQSMTPYVRISHEWITISLNKLGGPIHLSQALHDFDPDINAKSKISPRTFLEMIQV